MSFHPQFRRILIAVREASMSLFLQGVMPTHIRIIDILLLSASDEEAPVKFSCHKQQYCAYGNKYYCRHDNVSCC